MIRPLGMRNRIFTSFVTPNVSTQPLAVLIRSIIYCRKGF
jgi:hypothetical protein